MRVKFQSFVGAALLLGAACSVLSCASADTEPPLGRVRSGISGGQPDSTDSNVFLLVSHRKDGVALCTASLIAPNLLLTARHCVAAVSDDAVTCGQTTASAPFAASTLLAANAASEEDITVAYPASAVSVPTDGSDICGYDLALVTLAEVVPASVAVPLVPRIDRPVSQSEVYRAIGYGLDSAGDAGVAGFRRARDRLQVNCAPGRCGEGVEASEFVGGSGVCSGDSGGPALDAAGKVVGVASRSANDCARPVYGSVASWKDWISSVAKQAALQGKYSAPFWVDSGLSDPAPASVPDAGGSAEAGAAGVQGDRCTGPDGCDSGFACYSPTRLASDGYCAATCTAQAQCGNGTTCQVGLGVCVTNPRADSGSSSCSLSALGQRGNATSPVLLAGVALACVMIGRQRRRASRAKRLSRR